MNGWLIVMILGAFLISISMPDTKNQRSSCFTIAVGVVGLVAFISGLMGMFGVFDSI